MDIIERPLYSPHHCHNYTIYMAIREAGCMGRENWLVHKQVLQAPLLALILVTVAMCMSTCVMIVMKASLLLLNKPTALTHVSVFNSHPRNLLQAAHEDGPRLHLRWRVEVCERTVRISISCAEIESGFFKTLQSGYLLHVHFNQHYCS